jgi:hypothetical protein
MLAAGKLLAGTEAQGLAIGVIEWCCGCRHKVGLAVRYRPYRTINPGVG